MQCISLLACYRRKYESEWRIHIIALKFQEMHILIGRIAGFNFIRLWLPVEKDKKADVFGFSRGTYGIFELQLTTVIFQREYFPLLIKLGIGETVTHTAQNQSIRFVLFKWIVS
ncbi:hypothetical protein D3C77_576940 [compost metagenome]